MVSKKRPRWFTKGRVGTAILSVAVLIISSSAFAAAPLYELNTAPYARTFDVTPDGSAIAFTRIDTESGEVTVLVQHRGEPAKPLPGHLRNGERGDEMILTRPRWSPDGATLAYFGSAVDGRLILYLWDRRKDKTHAVAARIACDALCRSYDPQWSPDARHFYYLAENEALRKIDASAYSGSPSTLRERRELAFEDPAHQGVTVRTAEVRHPSNDSAVVRRREDIGTAVDVVAADAASGCVRTIAEALRVQALALSPDGTKLLAFGWNEREGRQQFHDIYRLHVPVQGSSCVGESDPMHHPAALRPLLSKIKQFVPAISWSPHSDRFAFTEQGPLSSGDVFVVNARTGAIENLTAAIALGPQVRDRDAVDHFDNRDAAYGGKLGDTARPPLWSADGSSLYLIRDRYETHAGTLWRLRLANRKLTQETKTASGTVEDVINQGGVIVSESDQPVVLARSPGGAQFITSPARLKSSRPLLHLEGMFSSGVSTSWALASHARTLFVTLESRQRPSEIFATPLQPGAELIQVTAVNTPPEVSVDVFAVKYHSSAGNDSLARLLVPRTTGARVRGAPVIMQVYPGLLFARRIDGYPLYPATMMAPLPVLLRRGYAILQPEMTVHGGGNSCDGVARDAVAALDAAGDAAPVDTHRAIIVGTSFGGWSVNCVITRTDRFKAAVSVAGISDFVSFSLSPYGRIYTFGGGQAQMAGSLWEAPNSYIAESPVYHLRGVSTPLLLVHGKDDVAVPVEQSVEMFEGLRALGKTADLVTYDATDHANVSEHPDYASRISDWIVATVPPE